MRREEEEGGCKKKTKEVKNLLLSSDDLGLFVFQKSNPHKQCCAEAWGDCSHPKPEDSHLVILYLRGVFPSESLEIEITS